MSLELKSLFGCVLCVMRSDKWIYWLCSAPQSWGGRGDPMLYRVALESCTLGFQESKFSFLDRYYLRTMYDVRCTYRFLPVLKGYADRLPPLFSTSLHFDQRTPSKWARCVVPSHATWHHHFLPLRYCCRVDQRTANKIVNLSSQNEVEIKLSSTCALLQHFWQL